MPHVAPLAAFGREDLPLAGGKGANLGELVRMGMPVPGGFVVTTEAYASLRATSADRQGYENAAIPGELRDAILAAYADLGRGAVAVRSSATAEDLPGAAFAGQQDTYLNVRGDVGLLDAVRRCWASLWTDRAVAYRARLGIDPAEVRIAVVVQRMVDADVAGVMFTAHPVTGDRESIVVEASSGLGEAVVSGLVTPDHYVLDARGTVREFAAGRREVVVRAAAGGGVVHETPADAASVDRLPGAVLAELARLGTAVAAHFGRPQDIEWAVAAGRVHLLQARPMTAVPPPPLRGRVNPLRRRLAAVLLELLPTRPYPIDMTTWIPYGPAGLMAKVTESIGLRGAFEGFLREEDGVVYRFVPPEPRPTPRLLLAPFVIARRARRYDPARWRDDPRYATFRAQVRDLAARDVSRMPWQELVRIPREALALVDPVAGLRIDYLPGAGVAIARLFFALRLTRRGRMLGDLLLDGRTRTEQATRELEQIAAEVRSDPVLAARLVAEEPAAVLPALRQLPAFAAFLDEHGHRESSSPLLVTAPTWGEAPETVVGLLTVLATAPPARAARPPLSAFSARMRRWIERARVGTAFREDTHYEFTRPLPILRRALLEIGRRLVAEGVLERPDDVFHLRLDELEAGPDRRLRDLARTRAARRDELAGVRMIDPRAVFPARDSGDALVAGEPASGGRVTGPVCIIRGPEEFGRLHAGDVLVCPYTNPSWTPLFQRAAAVVVDSGGLGSHAAIVAREYGIPAIMGTAVGTTVLQDGQVVTVDGDTGHVGEAS
ncbi:phosphoenolpyruvate synthase [Microbacterium sp. CFH 90308]|uniref:Phosphoenolpyruvate synthase n=1 Tax=Microbacterium salsuginis TaxID=2722803 RepID=A0ABX1K8U7_9MICO|nr:PEP/pyruvate-binding domain-containing protein [Microbacterium sp. CFH 90308]NLP83429.1 phosphoenolpyruvate synthase [Microbacterium sp. CFH 90308]